MSAGVIFSIAWAVGALVTFRPVFRGFSTDYGGADWEDVIMLLVITVMVAGFFWYAALAFLALRALVSPHDPEKFARRLAGESSEQKVERLERERKEREAHIASLERELGIGDPA